MAELITLDYFLAAHRQYHIYRIKSSAVDEQPHYHDYFQVCFVASGEILHRQDYRTVTLGPGEAFIIPPGFCHSLHFNDSYSEIYSLSFVDSLFHAGFMKSNIYQFLSNLQNHTSEQQVLMRIVLDARQQSGVRMLMNALVAEQEADCPPGLSAAPSLITAMLYMLAQGYYQKPQNSLRLSEMVNYSSTLEQCIQYIDRNYKEKLSLSALAKQFGMSRSAFGAVFPQYAGMTLGRYIAQKRIQEALLRIRTQPEMPLSQIASEVGYEDDSTFYRNFLKIAGIAPSKYRELYIGKNTQD